MEQLGVPTDFEDGWMRIWGEIPEFHDWERGLLRDWVNEDKFTHVAIYLSDHHDLDSDQTEFVIREILRGNV